MNAVIKDSLQRSMSYEVYRNLVKQLADENSTTGLEKTEALTNYTKLNDRRMKRWDKMIKVSDENKAQIKSFKVSMTWLIITESWCGDAAHVIPALNKISELNPGIDIKIVLRDENLELMDSFLTNGGRAIAKVIIIDNATGNVVNTYGPRPTDATHLVSRYKAKRGQLTPEFKEDLQRWYNGDKGQNIIKDLTHILCELEPAICL